MNVVQVVRMGPRRERNIRSMDMPAPMVRQKKVSPSLFFSVLSLFLSLPLSLSLCEESLGLHLWLPFHLFGSASVGHYWSLIPRARRALVEGPGEWWSDWAAPLRSRKGSRIPPKRSGVRAVKGKGSDQKDHLVVPRRSDVDRGVSSNPQVIQRVLFGFMSPDPGLRRIRLFRGLVRSCRPLR